MKETGLLLLLSTLVLIECKESSDTALVKGSGNFQAKNGEVIISGTLYLPENLSAPVPVIIIVPGSGNGSREEGLPFVDIFHSIGFAVVLYDKRGTGDSTGELIQVSAENSTETIPLRASDVNAIVNLLKGHQDILNDKIGVLAASQGSWVSSAIQGAYGSLDFIINSSGGVASVGLSDFYDGLMDDESLTPSDGVAQLAQFSGEPGFDPISIIQNIDIPTLWLYGSEDRSHPVLYDAEILSGLSKANFQVEVFQNATHELVDIGTNQLHSDVIPKTLEWLANNF